ncbi:MULTISPECIES: ferrous iron transporter B [unclassified Novosphingobium]|uniref:ferrous iron transporter B n=1 Tax=unclassified Novosphingobium TaxID=2644732 RepID=UPI001494B75D|nr:MULTISPECIES: ferrous iron transporter B [unclassified Novosphingobium]MBB3359608.1 ferrous iron transport protein B [Novosphingobium sp. BK256]MBB3376026.1 ferrous iron transport protein B [Novosphingobium sp. BK280]MBB3380381.1 ferrous iron transport protein B [Novosphingobium sp. BK258]MBB3422033.1 ferrous iron transport protein B [Novosphingobium sp. BK267]MBB3450790.1 ferrous iron transport protein B [Novosphingobium sp. BK352]
MSRGPFVAALVGNPNAGKSALFNALTGARQKIANYPGVTVERKAGRLLLPSGEPVELVDLPGSYGFAATSPDEEVTRKVIMGEQVGQVRPDVLVIVLDASNLEQHLVFAQEVLELGRPTVVALNMVDLAARDGLTIDAAALAAELGVPVIETVAVRRKGLAELAAAIAVARDTAAGDETPAARVHVTLPERRLLARQMAQGATLSETARHRIHARMDRVLLHPWLGPPVLFALLFVVFQAMFTWAKPFQDGLDGAASALQDLVRSELPASLLRDLLADAIIGGVGAVIVFLPLILILFFFILVMEATGYMARAAFLMDRMMAGVGLSGRSFIPLLSSFACAIPGIMATRSITDPKDRLTTILIAPLMTCSARLPVYAVIIAAFIPNTRVLPGVGLQGLVLFGLYVAGIVGAMVVALVLRRSITKGAASGFIMELPKYQLPTVKDLALGLWQRAWVFLRRAGTMIFTVTVVLWLLLNFPRAEPGKSQVDASIAGHIANGLAVVVEPIGFNRDIALALIPSMAAREVAVSSLATSYAVDNSDEDAQGRALGDELKHHWSLATALAFLAWFVFAPQCMSTIAVTRRETNGWKWPGFMLGYLFALAYAFAGITYWTAVAFGLG